MDSREPVQINITVNIIAGNITRSAIIQGGDDNLINVSPDSLPTETLELILELAKKTGVEIQGKVW